MSTIKVKNIQVGQDVDPNKNFTVRVPTTPDGSLEIRRGNSDAPGNLLAKINSDGGVNTGGPAFSAYSSAATSLTQNVATKVGFQTKEFDTSNNYDTTLSRYTPNVAGYYFVNAAIQLATTGASTLVSVYKNGASFKNGPFGAAVSSSGADALVFLNGTTDYLEIYCTQVAATQNTTVAANQTYFQAYLVRAT